MTLVQARPPATYSATSAGAAALTARPRRFRVGLVLAAIDIGGALGVALTVFAVAGTSAPALEAPGVALAWLCGLALAGEYRQFGGLGARTRRLVLVALALPTALLVLAEAAGREPSTVPLAAVCLACAAASCAGRTCLDVAVRRGVQLRGLTHRVVLVGPAHALSGVQERLAQHAHRFRVVATCSVSPGALDGSSEGVRTAVGSDTAQPGDGLGAADGIDGLDGLDGLDGIGPELPVDPEITACRMTITSHDADTVVLVPDPSWAPERVRQLRWALEDDVVRTFAWTGLWRAPAGRTHLDLTDDLPMLHVSPPRQRGPARAVKVVLDRVVAAVALVLVSPLLLAVVVAIRLDSPGPAFYRQQRTGRGGAPFTIWKFRTMDCRADQRRAQLLVLNEGAGPLFKLRRDPRVTRVGGWLRRTSLDELPQLINVLRGEMSLVGPRPALPAEVRRYPAELHHRLTVPPGMTGLWQVSGRSDLSWAESVHLDLTYVDNWSLLLDLQILTRTATAVLRGRGAY